MAHHPAYDALGRSSEQTASKLRSTTSEGRPRPRPWVRGYVLRLAWSDVLIVAVAVGVAQVIRFGADSAMTSAGALEAPAIVVSLALIVTWIAALRAFQTLDRRVVGSGPTEYSRVATACFAVFGVLAILDLLFRLNIARGFLAVALPLGTLGLLCSRWAWRQRLRRQRANSKNTDQLLVVGDVQSALPLVKRLNKKPTIGLEVVGLCLPPGERTAIREIEVGDQAVPVYGGCDSISDAVIRSSASVVAITSRTPAHEFIRELSWELDRLDVEVLVAPGVADIAGPRMMMRQVDGLPMLHIDKPRYGASQTVLKTGLDYVVALTVLALSAPVIIATAVAIKAYDGGPVFFRHQRVGKDGQRFKVWKFRSMRPDADTMKDKVRADDTDGVTRAVFFKAEDDPRITPIGRFIRRTSIDELPQLFNVLSRDMSIVGPRPLVPGEGSEIPNFVERRLLVKPGITGLWQVSGRSDLPEEDRIRLDLVYVENWSLMQDISILWKTTRAVIQRDGAY
ncbi:sugar transferase [Gordonia amicalis]|uniref:sugar transferase n=1 Tax=Gordonia amicalis TaxID=89053 RepID=UPI0022B443BD|nr:sugar transferase [Gordonia amicalis]MCZ4581837.1 sugar transferase [Gordonia amicalis]